MTADVPERSPHLDEKNIAAEVGAPEPLAIAHESDNSHSKVSDSKTDGEAEEEEEDGKANKAAEEGQERRDSTEVDVEMKDLTTENEPENEKKDEAGVDGKKKEEEPVQVKTEDEEMADARPKASKEVQLEAPKDGNESKTTLGPEEEASTAGDAHPAAADADVDNNNNISNNHSNNTDNGDNNDNDENIIADGTAESKPVIPQTPPKTPPVQNIENEAAVAQILAQHGFPTDNGAAHSGLPMDTSGVIRMQLDGDVTAIGDFPVHESEMIKSATFPLTALDSMHHGIPGVDMTVGASSLDFPVIPMPETPVHQLNGNSTLNLNMFQTFSPPMIPTEPEESRIIAYAMLRFDHGYDFYMKDYNLILGREDHSQQHHQQKQLELHDEHQNEFGPSATLSTQAQSGMDSLSPGLAALDTPLLSKKKKSKKSGSSSHKSGSRKGKSSSSSQKALNTNSIGNGNGNTEAAAQATDKNQNEAVEDPYANEQFLKIVHPDGRPLNNISRRHARIAYNFETRSFELQVLGKNGAFVDEHHYRTGTVAPLANDTKVQIGRVVFRFLLPISEEEEDTAMNDAGNNDLDNKPKSKVKEGKAHGKTNGEHRMSLSFHDEKGVELPPDSFDDDAVGSSDSSLTPIDSDDLDSDGEVDLDGIGDRDGDEDEEVMEDEEDMKYDSDGVDLMGDGDDEGENDGGKEGSKGRKDGNPSLSSKRRGRPPKEKIPKEKRPRGRRPEPEKAKRRELEKIAERESAMAKALAKEKEKELKEKVKEEERRERQEAKRRAQEEKRLRKQRKEEEKMRQQREKEERKQQQQLEKEAKMRENKEAKQQQQETKPPKPLKEKKKKKKKRSPSPPINEADLPPEALLKPTIPYSVMIFDAIVNSESKKLSLPDLYRSIERSYPYFKLRAGTSGWQSSVRHNLRGCPDLFYTVAKEGKGYLWGVKEGANVDKERKKRRGVSSPPPQQAQGVGYQSVPAPTGFAAPLANSAPMAAAPPPHFQIPQQPNAVNVAQPVARAAPVALAPAPQGVTPAPKQSLQPPIAGFIQPQERVSAQPHVQPQTQPQPKIAPQNANNAMPATSTNTTKPILPSAANKAASVPQAGAQRIGGSAVLPASNIPQKRPANAVTTPQTRPPAARPGVPGKAQLDQKTIAALTTFQAALTAQLKSGTAAGGNKSSTSGGASASAAGSGNTTQIQNALQNLGGGANSVAVKALLDVLKNAGKVGAASGGATRPNAGSSSAATARPQAGKAPSAPGQASSVSKPLAGASSTAAGARPQPSQQKPASGALAQAQLMQMLSAVMKKAGAPAQAGQASQRPAVATGSGVKLPAPLNRAAPKPNANAAAIAAKKPPGNIIDSNKRPLENDQTTTQTPAKRPAVQQQ